MLQGFQSLDLGAASRATADREAESLAAFRSQGLLARALRAWRESLEWLRGDPLPRDSRVVTAAATGWLRVCGACEWFRIASTSAGARRHYVVFGGEQMPQGTGSDTPGAVYLAEGQASAIPSWGVWVYLASGDVVRWEGGAVGMLGGPQRIEVLDASDAPTGTPSTVNVLTSATVVAAADLRRIYLDVTNTDASVDVWLSFGTPVASRGIYLPAGRSRWFTGTLAKGALSGIAASTVAVAVEKVVT